MLFFINSDSLKTEIQKYSEIVIYGAGVYASLLYDYLKTIREDHRIIAIVQTNASGRIMFKGRQVYSIYDIDRKKECLYIIAVNKIHNDEIKKILFRYGCENHIFFSDFVLDGIRDITKYCNSISCEKFIDTVMMNHLITNGERIEHTLSKSKKIDKKRICFVLPFICVRNANIARCLSNHGFDIEILCYTEIEYSGASDLEHDGITVKKVNGLVGLFYSLIFSNAFIYYIDAADADASVAETIIRKKELFGKVVFTAYDLCNVAYRGMDEYKYESEIFSIANADGVVWRYDAKDYYLRRFNIDTNDSSIFFPDYFFKTTETYLRNDDNLMLYSIPVHADSILGSYTNQPVSFTTVDSIMKWIGNRENVYFHIYCWYVSEEELSELEALSDKYDRFEYYVRVEHDVLLNRIAKYDYFLNLTDEDKPLWINRDNLGYNEEVVFYAMSNRLYEAASVGVPSISTFPVRECNDLSNKGVLIKKRLSQLDLDELISNKSCYKKAVIRNRDELCINAHINELIDFFEMIGSGDIT